MSKKKGESLILRNKIFWTKSNWKCNNQKINGELIHRSEHAYKETSNLLRFIPENNQTQKCFWRSFVMLMGQLLPGLCEWVRQRFDVKVVAVKMISSPKSKNDANERRRIQRREEIKWLELIDKNLSEKTAVRKVHLMSCNAIISTVRCCVNAVLRTRKKRSRVC